MATRTPIATASAPVRASRDGPRGRCPARAEARRGNAGKDCHMSCNARRSRLSIDESTYRARVNSGKSRHRRATRTGAAWPRASPSQPGRRSPSCVTKRRCRTCGTFLVVEGEPSDGAPRSGVLFARTSKVEWIFRTQHLAAATLATKAAAGEVPCASEDCEPLKNFGMLVPGAAKAQTAWPTTARGHQPRDRSEVEATSDLASR